VLNTIYSNSIISVKKSMCKLLTKVALILKMVMLESSYTGSIPTLTALQPLQRLISIITQENKTITVLFLKREGYFLSEFQQKLLFSLPLHLYLPIYMFYYSTLSYYKYHYIIISRMDYKAITFEFQSPTWPSNH
jgi:hypothetical protein